MLQEYFGDSALGHPRYSPGIYSDGQVRFSSVLRAFFLNPEPDPQFGSTYCAELRTERLVLVLKGSVPVQPPREP